MLSMAKKKSAIYSYRASIYLPNKFPNLLHIFLPVESREGHGDSSSTPERTSGKIFRVPMRALRSRRFIVRHRAVLVVTWISSKVLKCSEKAIGHVQGHAVVIRRFRCQREMRRNEVDFSA